MPDNRYEHAASGDMLHLDIKKLGRFKRPGHRVTGDRRKTPKRGPGWEYVHVAIDENSRIAFASIHPDETACQPRLSTSNQPDRPSREQPTGFTQLVSDPEAGDVDHR